MKKKRLTQLPKRQKKVIPHYFEKRKKATLSEILLAGAIRVRIKEVLQNNKALATALEESQSSNAIMRQAYTLAGIKVSMAQRKLKDMASSIQNMLADLDATLNYLDFSQLTSSKIYCNDDLKIGTCPPDLETIEESPSPSSDSSNEDELVEDASPAINQLEMIEKSTADTSATANVTNFLITNPDKQNDSQKNNVTTEQAHQLADLDRKGTFAVPRPIKPFQLPRETFTDNVTLNSLVDMELTEIISPAALASATVEMQFNNFSFSSDKTPSTISTPPTVNTGSPEYCHESVGQSVSPILPEELLKQQKLSIDLIIAAESDLDVINRASRKSLLPNPRELLNQLNLSDNIDVPDTTLAKITNEVMSLDEITKPSSVYSTEKAVVNREHSKVPEVSENLSNSSFYIATPTNSDGEDRDKNSDREIQILDDVWETNDCKKRSVPVRRSILENPSLLAEKINVSIEISHNIEHKLKSSFSCTDESEQSEESTKNEKSEDIEKQTNKVNERSQGDDQENPNGETSDIKCLSNATQNTHTSLAKPPIVQVNVKDAAAKSETSDSKKSSTAKRNKKNKTPILSDVLTEVKENARKCTSKNVLKENINDSTFTPPPSKARKTNSAGCLKENVVNTNLEGGVRTRRTRPTVNYKEPTLNKKMRRD